MSPEQAEMSGLDIDTQRHRAARRLLYELLHGARPSIRRDERALMKSGERSAAGPQTLCLSARWKGYRECARRSVSKLKAGNRSRPARRSRLIVMKAIEKIARAATKLRMAWRWTSNATSPASPCSRVRRASSTAFTARCGATARLGAGAVVPWPLRHARESGLQRARITREEMKKKWPLQQRPPRRCARAAFRTAELRPRGPLQPAAWPRLG